MRVLAGPLLFVNTMVYCARYFLTDINIAIFKRCGFEKKQMDGKVIFIS